MVLVQMVGMLLMLEFLLMADKHGIYLLIQLIHMILTVDTDGFGMIVLMKIDSH